MRICSVWPVRWCRRPTIMVHMVHMVHTMSVRVTPLTLHTLRVIIHSNTVSVSVTVTSLSQQRERERVRERSITPRSRPAHRRHNRNSARHRCLRAPPHLPASVRWCAAVAAVPCPTVWAIVRYVATTTRTAPALAAALASRLNPCLVPVPAANA